MLTVEQIKLKGMCYFDRAALEEMLTPGAAKGQCGGHDSLDCLALYDAFLVIIGAVEGYACSVTAFQAFKGFLAIELQQDSVQATSTLRATCSFFRNIGALDDDDVVCIMNATTTQCEESYRACKPSAAALEHYRSWYATSDPGVGVHFNLATIHLDLSEQSQDHLRPLLVTYFGGLSAYQATVDAGLIQGLLQGLVHQNPRIVLSELRLGAKASKRFVSDAKHHSDQQMEWAGYSVASKGKIGNSILM
ncbi:MULTISPECIES: hypothetical protein [unclassified Pseudomonas]|uniref:hypothetical protein n=1 Tax=unclassified Pseudomonas TaxID=196821 RepID=UPI00177EF871|nr:MULTISPECIES: hypothetical protein [unclassified Pseudomonas]MBD8591992.1 hypothetical protein [Pseudomonas sp. CFBP 8758]MBD8733477.1 hypothetical protein [Pseudomonas sp. CFBP 13710]